MLTQDQRQEIFDNCWNTALTITKPAISEEMCQYKFEGSLKNGCIFGRQMPENYCNPSFEGRKASDVMDVFYERKYNLKKQLSESDREFINDIQTCHDRHATSQTGWTKEPMINSLIVVATTYSLEVPKEKTISKNLKESLKTPK